MIIIIKLLYFIKCKQQPQRDNGITYPPLAELLS